MDVVFSVCIVRRGAVGAKPAQHTETIQRQFKTVVPQGGVLSLTLFIIYATDLPRPRALVHVMAYTGVITIASTYTSTSAAKANMCHIHTSIVSRHIATRGTTIILHTPPSHISSSEEILPHLTHHTLAQQINHPFLNHTYTKLTPNHIHHHYAPIYNSNNTRHLFNCTHIHTTLSPLDLWTDPAGVAELLARWTEKLVGGPQAGRSGSSL